MAQETVHLHYNGFMLLSQKNMVFGLPKIVNKNKVYEGSMLGK